MSEDQKAFIFFVLRAKPENIEGRVKLLLSLTRVTIGRYETAY